MFRPGDWTWSLEHRQAYRIIEAVPGSGSWKRFLIHPPTDDRPFFFNFLRGTIKPPSPAEDPFLFLNLWNDALVLIYMLIAVVTTLAVLFFLGPLLLCARQRTHHVGARVATPLLLYFACLGYGFMIIEIPLMGTYIIVQRRSERRCPRRPSTGRASASGSSRPIPRSTPTWESSNHAAEEAHHN